MCSESARNRLSLVRAGKPSESAAARGPVTGAAASSSRWKTIASLAVLVGALSIAVASPSSARADEPTDEGMAQSLFDAGRALMDQGKPEEACPKFEESNKLDPSAGTLLNLGKCFEALGRTASAWASYKKAITVGKSTGQSRHVTAAEEFIATIEPKLSKMTVEVLSTNPNLVVRRVDVRPGSVAITIPEAARGVPVAVDPGEYKVEAEAPGFMPWSSTITIGREADTQSVTVPELTPKKPEPRVAKPVPSTSGPGPLRIAAYTTGGAAIVLLGVGATLGGLTLADASTAESNPALCPRKKCTPLGEEFVENARNKGIASTALIAVGGVAVAASATLFVLSLGEKKAPSKPRSGLVFLPFASPGFSRGTATTIGVTLGGTL